MQNTNKTVNKPKIGQLIKVRDIQCRITVIRDFGTLDCEALDGSRAFRVSGLLF
jgi:hypothetical protein